MDPENTPPDPLIKAAADAVADDESVDWKSLPILDSTLKGLQKIERIMSAFRSAANIPESRPAPEEPAERKPLFEWGQLLALEKLGEGNFGEIYRAFDTKLEREVALKLRKPESQPESQSPGSEPASPTRGGPHIPAEPGLTEARRLARVRHPNVLSVHGVDVRDGRTGMWTDLLRGQTLEECLEAEGVMEAEGASLVGLSLCRALASVHAADIVHGDVKAANVMREESGTIVLLDFGSGRDLSERGGRGRQETLSGTPLYLAPEIFDGADPDPTTDLYALGVLLYRLVSRQYPVPAARIEELLEKHDRAERIPLSNHRSDLPSTFVSVVEQAIAPDPAQRFGSAGEFERALAGLFHRIPPTDQIGSDGAVSRPTTPPGSTASIGDKSIAAAWSTGGFRRGTIQDVPNNLPERLSRFVGRVQQLTEIASLLGTNRLVTLSGTGGCGKTRLAVETAKLLLGECPDGVWLVELAAVRDPSLVPRSVASVLGVRDAHEDDLIDTLAQTLAGQRTLLVLDNCEHLIDPCAEFCDRLLRRDLDLRILVTSREHLGIIGEADYQLLPLTLPDADPSEQLEEIRKSEAVQLFADRAKHASSFELTEDNAQSVIQICRRLDGIPLALELSAARTRMLHVDQIAERLDDRFKLLTGGDRASLPRHQTLRAMIDWSHDQLEPSEKMFFRRLSVFSGGWTLESAESICSGSGLEEGDILDLLARLLEKSVVTRDRDEEAGRGTARYSLFESIRHYAIERCDESGEVDELRAKHRHYFLELARQSEIELKGPKQEIWSARLDAEKDNLRVALEFCFADDSDPSLCQAMAASLGRYWSIRGYWNEGRESSVRALARSSEETAIRANLLNWIGNLTMHLGDYEKARAAHEESLKIRTALRDKKACAVSLSNLGLVAHWRGDTEEALLRHEESLAIKRELGDRWGMAASIQNLGMVAEKRNDETRALGLYEEALVLWRELGHRAGEAGSLSSLGVLAFRTAEYVRAGEFFSECLEIMTELGNMLGISRSLGDLAQVAIELDDIDRARELSERSLKIQKELGDPAGTARTMVNLGTIAQRQGDLSLAGNYYEEGLEVERELGDPGRIGGALRLLADLYSEDGDLDRARACLEEAANGYAPLDRNRNSAQVLTDLGLLDLRGRDRAGARAHFEQARAYAIRSEKGFTILALARAYAALLALEAEGSGSASQLLGAADSIEATESANPVVGSRLEPSIIQDRAAEETVRILTDSLGEIAFSEQRKVGSRLTLDQLRNLVESL